MNEAGGFGFPAHPFSRGSERFKRGGQGMPWDDLEADGYTGIELWSFVTDTAERVNSIRDLLSFVAHAAAVPGPPAAAQPRRVGPPLQAPAVRRLGGADAHQIGIRVGGRVPLRLMAYKRSFRHLRTHLLVDAAAAARARGGPRRGVRRAAGRARLPRGGLGRAGAAASGSGPRATAALSMGDEAPAQATGRCACGCPHRPACG